jgi:hypothetical protein
MTRDGTPAWRLGVGLTNPCHKKSLLWKVLNSLGPRWILWIKNLSDGIWRRDL